VTEEGKTLPQLSDEKWVMTLSFILDKTAYFCKIHKLARDNDFADISLYRSQEKTFYSRISMCTTVGEINIRVCMGYIHLLRHHGSFRSEIASVFLVITVSRPELMKLKVQVGPQVPKGYRFLI
jgi:hypothetical protein